MRGKHKPEYRAPRTGEKRKTRQPFKLDSLSQEVRDSILKSRSQGFTWEETAERASKVAGEKIGHSVCHRWYDVRVEQARAEVMAQDHRAHEVAAAFAANGFEKLPEAVQAALASRVFALMEANGAGNTTGFNKALADLGWLLSDLQRTDLQREKLALEKEKVSQGQQKLELLRARIVGIKAESGKKKLSAEQLQQRLDDIYGIVKDKI